MQKEAVGSSDMAGRLAFGKQSEQTQDGRAESRRTLRPMIWSWNETDESPTMRQMMIRLKCDNPNDDDMTYATI